MSLGGGQLLLEMSMSGVIRASILAIAGYELKGIGCNACLGL